VSHLVFSRNLGHDHYGAMCIMCIYAFDVHYRMKSVQI